MVKIIDNAEFILPIILGSMEIKIKQHKFCHGNGYRFNCYNDKTGCGERFSSPNIFRTDWYEYDGCGEHYYITGFGHDYDYIKNISYGCGSEEYGTTGNGCGYNHNEFVL